MGLLISLATVRVVNDCGGNPYCLPTPVLAQQVAWGAVAGLPRGCGPSAE